MSYSVQVIPAELRTQRQINFCGVPQKRSLKRWRLLAASLLVMAALPANAATIQWDGGAATSDWSTSGNWVDTGDWSTDLGPSDGDTLYLTTVGTSPTNLDILSGSFGAINLSNGSALSVTGNSVTIGTMSGTFNRNVTYTSGSPVVQVSGSNMVGIAPGMLWSGVGFAAGTTVSSVDTINGTVTLSTSATTTQAAFASRTFGMGSDVTWGTDLVLTNSTSLTPISVAAGRTLTILGNVSGVGGFGAGSGALLNGTVVLKGTNTYSGPTHINNGTLFLGTQSAISPNTEFGSSNNAIRFGNDAPAFSYTVPNTFVTPIATGGKLALSAGGRLELTGSIGGTGAGVNRQWQLDQVGSAGTALYILSGTFDAGGGLSAAASAALVRLDPELTLITGTAQIWSGQTGSIDFAGHDIPTALQLSVGSAGGAQGSGALQNSSLTDPTILSGSFNSFSGNSASRDFGGRGTIILDGPVRFGTGNVVGNGVDKVGPGLMVLRFSSADISLSATQANEVWNGTLALDYKTNTVDKTNDDAMLVGNGKVAILGNDNTSVTVTSSMFELTGAPLHQLQTGYSELELISGSTAGLTYNLTTLKNTSANGGGDYDMRTFNLSAIDGGGGVPVITASAMTDGTFGATYTYNKTQWLKVLSGTLQGHDPEVLASDATTFEAAPSLTRNVDITASFATTNSSSQTTAKTLRFAQATDTTLTLNRPLRLAQDSTLAGILITPSAGAVTIDGTSKILMNNNNVLAINHFGSNPLQIDAQIDASISVEFTKTGPGELILTNTANDFNRSYLYGGTTSIPMMANTGTTQPLGVASTISIGSKNTVTDYATGAVTVEPAALKYIGTGHSTDRRFTVFGPASIVADGSGLIDFTYTGTFASTTLGAYNDLYLSGSGNGRFAGTVDLGLADLYKAGPGTWTVASTGTVYSVGGNIRVQAGALQMDGEVANQLSTIVASGALLGGSGKVRGDVNVNAGGNIAAGAVGGGIGKLTIGSADAPGYGRFTLSGTYQWELGALQDDVGGTAGVDFDQIVGFASTTLASTSVFNISLGALESDPGNVFWDSNHQWKVLDIQGLGSLTNAGITLAGITNFAGGNFSLDSSSGDLMLLYVIPEPTSWAMLLGGAGVLALFRRRSARVK